MPFLDPIQDLRPQEGRETEVVRYLGLPLATYYTYVAHLAILTPMLVLEVPFGKWAHLAYRPLAIYFQRVKELAVAQQAKKERLASFVA